MQFAKYCYWEWKYSYLKFISLNNATNNRFSTILESLTRKELAETARYASMIPLKKTSFQISFFEAIASLHNAQREQCLLNTEAELLNLVENCKSKAFQILASVTFLPATNISLVRLEET